MKASEIVNALYINLPVQTNLFSEEIDIISLTRNNSIITATTSLDHPFSVGNYITITGALDSYQIISLTQSNNIATAETLNSHPLAKGWTPFVTINGADQPEYNGTHEIIDIIDSTHFTFKISGNPISPATGSIYLLTEFNSSYNGFHQILSVPSSNTFTYEITGSPESPAIGTIKGLYNHRISRSVNEQEAINSYTEQAYNDLWAYVILKETIRSKSRNTETDAYAAITGHEDIRSREILTFDIVVIKTVTQDTSGSVARDQMEDIYKYLVGSLFGLKFPSGFSQGSWSIVTTIGHSLLGYDGARYMHSFRFEALRDITYPDVVQPKTFPFRNIHIDYLDKNLENIIMTSNINLETNN